MFASVPEPLRGMIAPASLKPADSRRSLKDRRPLRGMIAPASLKPGLEVDATGHDRWATPGHDCPGLIEAAAAGPRHRRGRAPLRGMIAPASLKQATPAIRSGAPANPLRGMIAPASLKLAIAGKDRVKARKPTPGHDCPGLIEAREVVAVPRSPEDHSGA